MQTVYLEEENREMGAIYTKKSKNIRELLMVRGVRPDGKPKIRWIGDMFARMQGCGLTVYKSKDGLYQLRSQFKKGKSPYVHRDIELVAGVILKELDAEAAARKALTKKPPVHKKPPVQMELPLDAPVPEPVEAESELGFVGEALQQALEASGKTVKDLTTPPKDVAFDPPEHPYFEFSFDPATGPTLADVIRAVDLLNIRVGNITVRGYKYAR